ncbi:MAG: winged helix-turn-helix transcriptional regulator [Actinobacteria bacterium]|nr:winged helix-turn-helix transcriptional regulator [Actinomycetota bacterium]
MTMPRPNELPADLGRSATYLMVRLGKHAQASFTAGIEPLGLRPPHYDMLVTLAAGMASSQKDLSDVLRVDQARLVALLDEMEEAGFVTRSQDPADRRRNIVVLTKEGERVVARGRRIAADVERELVPLKGSQREEFTAMLRRLVDTARD